MTTDRWTDRPNRAASPFPGELVSDFRERLARQQAEASEQRLRELAEQTSLANSPTARIRIWERLHGLTLPRDPNHRLLQVVADGTGLPLEEVLLERPGIREAAVVGVPPEIMGIGPAPAIRLLLERSGLALADVARFEINEAQGAQTLAVARELGLDLERLNVKGGAIALGHPLAATGVRLTISVARQLREVGARWGVASACIGGGQGLAQIHFHRFVSFGWQGITGTVP